MEEVDERDVVGPCATSAMAAVIQLEPGVVLRAVGQVAVVQILMGDRREENEPRRARAVVLLPERVLDEVVKSLLN